MDQLTNSPYFKYAIVGVPLAALYWRAKYSGRGSKPIPGQSNVLHTDFDAFLHKMGSSPTGLPSGGKVAAGQRGKVSGPFDTFLKVDASVDERDPAVFSTFLKAFTGVAPGATGGKAQAVANGHHAAAAVEKAMPSPDMAKALILYGTEYGFSKEIAELLASKLLATKSIWPTVVNMADHPSGYDLSKKQAILVACSTQGDGVPPTEARDFCEWLFAGKAGSLSNTSFSVCALGDKSYTHFCKCGKTIDESLERSGAKRFADRQDVNKEDWKAVNEWIDRVLLAIPSLGLKTFKELGESCEVDSSAADSTAVKRWGKSRPFPAAVVEIEGLCQVASAADKNTMRVEFDLADSGLVYLPGDALGIYPTNCAKVVADTLASAGLDGETLLSVPSHHYNEEGLEKGGKMKLSRALSVCYDLRSPKTDIFKLLSSFKKADLASGVPNIGKLMEAVGAAEAYLAPRHVADVLRDFLPQGQGLSITELVSILRPLQARLYSISSSPLENPKRVQATIAEVKYESLGLDRIGVCSTFVSRVREIRYDFNQAKSHPLTLHTSTQRLSVGQHTYVYISKNPDFRLPENPSTPILMVGPGTGLAPFRSFIMQRVLEAGQSLPPGKMVLYFGCRRSDQDYLYGNVLEQWAKEEKITLLTAFSRQTAQKVYVQNRLKETSDIVWDLIHNQGAHFYVCGDASSMAGAVEAELLRLFEEKLGEGVEGSKIYLDSLTNSGRYERDVWFS